MVFSTNYVELHAWYVDRSVEGSLELIFRIFILLGFALALSCSGALRDVVSNSIRDERARVAGRPNIGSAGRHQCATRIDICFGIGVAVTAAGGMIYGATNAFNASSSYDLISRLLVIIVLGGMGSLGGALVAGIMMVTIEDLVAVVWGPVWSNLSFFLILVIVLSLRPQGLFGKQSVRVPSAASTQCLVDRGFGRLVLFR